MIASIRAQLTPEQFNDWLVEIAEFDYLADLLRKPLFGGVWGSGNEFSLASRPLEGDDGLHTLIFMIFATESHLPFAYGRTKVEALANGRCILKRRGAAAVLAGCASARAVVFERRLRAQAAVQAVKGQAASVVEPTQRDQTVPARRRRVFVASGGKCHYCNTPLDIHGAWHIEHKHPRALLGDNKPSNLVAACVGCNHTKGDMTEQEFRAGERAQIEGEPA